MLVGQKLRDQLFGSVAWIIGSANGTADRDAGRPGFNDVTEIGEVDSANRVPGQSDLSGDFPHEIKTRKLAERFGSGLKCRADTDVTRAVDDCLSSLLNRMSGDSDQTVRPHNSPHVMDAQFFLADVHTVCLAQGGQIRPIIHDQQGSGLPSDAADLSSEFDQLAILHRFFSNLHDPDSASDCLVKNMFNAPVAQIRTQKQIDISLVELLS